MHFPLLNEIIVIFSLSTVVLLICHRLGLPTIVGFLLTGVVAGPHGFGLVSAVKEVEQLAEIGIVLLLFTIGLELSLKTLLESRRTVLLGGGLQVILAVGATFLVVSRGERTWEQALFVGFLVSLSSTAIVLKLLQDRGEVDSPNGRMAVGVLIFQDIAAIPMMLLSPVLAGVQSGTDPHPIRFVAILVGTFVLLALGTRYLLPFALHQVARTRNRELFLVTIITVCFVVAWLTSAMGLSLALGAFLAGLIVSESEYSHTAVSLVLPFRDIFSSFFFVSVGMLLDVSYLLSQPLLIGSLTLGVLVLKTTVAAAITILMGYPLRIAVLVGLSLCQVGEFSFVLARGGMEYGLLDARSYSLFLAVSVMTMALTPLVLAVAPVLSATVERWPIPRRLKFGMASSATPPREELHGHLVIIGFGFNGQSLARAAAACKLPYVILEVQPDLVRSARSRGEPIHYGDATQEQVLRHIQVQQARVVVVAISDVAATRLVLSTVRSIHPSANVIVRTRYVHELAALYEQGASEVIPEEFETAVEIFTRVLKEYLVPRSRIDQLVARMRSGGYEVLRGLTTPELLEANAIQVDVPNVDVVTLHLDEGSPAASRTIAELALRSQYGVSLIVVRRGGELFSNPSADFRLEPGDTVTLIGTAEQIASVEGVFVLEDAAFGEYVK